MPSEFELIDRLKQRVPHKLSKGIGIGDDAALLSGSGKNEIAIATDTIVEGVDFLKGKARPEWIGRKALAVNLSDLAAMGATPSVYLVTLGLPERLLKKTNWILRLYQGMKPLAKKYGLVCVGGDITKARDFFVTVTVVGSIPPRKAVSRAGAKSGDWIGVTGSLGGSIVRKHFDFEPRVREGEYLSRRHKPSAMIDISDGTLQDLEHILRASRVGADIEINEVPISRDAFKLTKGNCLKALERALSDGEDFELLFTVNAKKKKQIEKAWRRKFPRVTLSWLGRIRKGKPSVRYTCSGERFRWKSTSKGYQHFS